MLLGALLNKGDRYPDVPEGLDLTIGWFVLVTVLGLLVWAWTRAPAFRRAVLGRDDPRIYAIMRIGLGLMTFQCFWNLKPYWMLLWSDEGMFLFDEAQQRLGRQALSGWTEESGFLGWWAVAKYHWSKPTLLVLHASPDYLTTYLAVFFVLLGLYTVGFRTRLTGFACFVLMLGIYNRNSVYLEGTDTVFKCLWLILLFARTGEAWSFDNALRVWRERRAARRSAGTMDWAAVGDGALWWVWFALLGAVYLQQLDMPRDPVWLISAVGIGGSVIRAWVQRHVRAAGDEPAPVVIYRRVPTWPRWLMMVQYGALYTTTGLVKTGNVWAEGDALYYALNMDHFYRFDGVTQQVSGQLGTNLFRVATWVTHWWEMLFPILVVGMLLRFRLRHEKEPWYRDMMSDRGKVWLGRIAFLIAYASLYKVLVESVPYLHKLDKKGNVTEWSGSLRNVNIVFLGIIPGLAVAWHVLARWPIQLIAPGKKLWKIPLPDVRLDRKLLRDWLFGRRVWLFLGAYFHTFLALFMNIGLFPVIMMLGYFSFFSAAPWLRLGRWTTRQLRKTKFTRWAAPTQLDEALADEACEPPERPSMRTWWLDPYVLVVGTWTALMVALRRKPGSALADVAEERYHRDAAFPAALVLALGSVPVFFMAQRVTPVPEQFVGMLGTLQWLLPVLGLIAVAGGVRNRDARWVITALVATGVFTAIVWALKFEPPTDTKEYREWLGVMEDKMWRWGYVCLAVGFVAGLFRTGKRQRPENAGRGPALGGGAFARVIAFGFFAFHATAFTVHLFPTRPVWRVWTAPMKKIPGRWLAGTATSQSWKMFAPNPPRSNSFMMTVVVTEDGEYWDLQNNAFHRTRPNPFIVNDRMRKMQRRMVGKGKWYLRYWANYHCRKWWLDEGEMPKEIQVYKLITKMPKPDRTKGKRWNPKKLKLRTVHVQTHRCLPTAEPPAYMKRRHGVELTQEDLDREERDREKRRRKDESRRKSWERRKDFGGEGPKEAGHKPTTPRGTVARPPKRG